MLRSEATASLILLASNATNYYGATKYGYQRNPRNVGMTLLFAVLTKKRFVQKLQHIRLPSSSAYPQYKYVYVYNVYVLMDMN